MDLSTLGGGFCRVFSAGFSAFLRDVFIGIPSAHFSFGVKKVFFLTSKLKWTDGIPTKTLLGQREKPAEKTRQNPPLKRIDPSGKSTFNGHKKVPMIEEKTRRKNPANPPPKVDIRIAGKSFFGRSTKHLEDAFR